MTTKTHAAGATPKLGFQESIQRWQNEISELLDAHDFGHQQRGKAYVSRIAQMQFDRGRSCIECKCQGSQSRPYVVTVKIDNEAISDIDCLLDAVCSCPYSGQEFYCKHTYAMVVRLQREFSLGAKSALVTSILGEEQPDWTVALRQIDLFLKESERRQGVAVIQDESAKTRLAWRVSTHQIVNYAWQTSQPAGRISFRLEAIEQSLGKRGAWTKGRSLKWEKIAHQSKLQLTPADLEVTRVAGRCYGYWGPSDVALGKCLEALIGHPQVLFNYSSIEVRRAQLGLAIQETTGKTWRVAAALDGRSQSTFTGFAICGGHAVGFSESEQVLFVAPASSEQIVLARAFADKEAVLPKEAHAELIKRLPALEAKLPVGLPETMKGALIDADHRLRLRITPCDPVGATIDLCVQPVAAGTFFAPGDGPLEVFGKSDDDERIRAERDLDGERFCASDLAKELFLHRFPTTDRFAWTIEGDDEVLDLLDTLRARDAEDPIVVWPEDAKVRRMRMLGEISASALRVEIKDQHDWFGISGSIELDGVKFPLISLLAALRGGRRYIDLGKGQFASISQAFRDRLAAVSDMLHSNRGKLEFNTTAAPVIADLLDEHVTVKASKTWKTTLTRLSRSADLEPQVPTTLTADLRDYQVDGFKWLRRLSEWGVGGCLADDMGLGKTVQALAVLLDRREVGPVLVIAPVSVGFNWVRECERFAPTLRPILYRDTDRCEFLKTLGPGDLLISSYYLVQQHADELKEVKWGTLVLDEAQNIKNSQTKTAQVVRDLKADWRLALTGTPAENHLGDLWSIFRGISPGLFGSWERFREVFGDPIEKSKDADRKRALSRVLRPFILRRTKSEVLKELPPRTEIQLTAELSVEERRRYEDARLWAITNLTDLTENTDKDQRFQVLAALTKLRQLACHPRLVDATWKKSSAKLDLFLETVDELRDGRHRALVFSQFTQHLGLIREALDERGIKYQYLDGQTPPKKRQERVDAFQRGEGDFFLISLKAGGTGLNLTGADYVIHLDPWWNPAVEDQATDRAHRIGQTRPVTVYRLVAKETIEEQILKLHATKRDLVAGILEGTDQAAKLSTKDLIALIRTGGNAING
ncbi:MAG: DEAD/DEAH box helicase [Planctomycetia bacterium]|nr:DEAD/DEAH box helicase [Planctomycetia bacterium]